MISSIAATFGWLCVETSDTTKFTTPKMGQPPSGGCVLKHWFAINYRYCIRQPPSGGCVLKLSHNNLSMCFVGSHLRVAVC